MNTGAAGNILENTYPVTGVGLHVLYSTYEDLALPDTRIPHETLMPLLKTVSE